MKKNKVLNFKNLPNAAKASIAFIIANVFIQGLHIITTPIFTRVLSTSDFGMVSVFNSWAALAGTIITLSLSSSAYNIGLATYENDKYKYTSSLLILSTLSALVFSLFGFTIRGTVLQLTGLTTPLILLIVLKSVVSQGQQFWLTMQRFEYKWKKPILYTIIIGVLSSFFSLFILLILKDKYTDSLAEIRIYSAAIITIPPMIYLYMKILIKGGKPSIAYWKSSLSLSLPMMVHLLAIKVLDSSDRVMINYFRGPSEAGMYSLVYTLAGLSMIIWTAINGSLVPFTFQKLKKEENKEINNIALATLVVYGMISILLILIAPEIIRIFAPPEYYSAVYVVPPVTISVYLTASYNLFANIEMYYKKTNLIMINTLVASGINVLLNYLFIPQFGFIAAAYTTLITNVFLVVFHYYGMKKVSQKNIYDTKFIFGFSFILICIGILISYTYEVLLARIILFIIIVLLLAYKKERIFSIFAALKKRS